MGEEVSSRVQGPAQDTRLDDIVQVQETGRRHVNIFLEYGYRLLAVLQRSKPSRDGYFIESDALYVMGRPEEVEELPYEQAMTIWDQRNRSGIST